MVPAVAKTMKGLVLTTTIIITTTRAPGRRRHPRTATLQRTTTTDGEGESLVVAPGIQRYTLFFFHPFSSSVWLCVWGGLGVCLCGCKWQSLWVWVSLCLFVSVCLFVSMCLSVFVSVRLCLCISVFLCFCICVFLCFCMKSGTMKLQKAIKRMKV